MFMYRRALAGLLSLLLAVGVFLVAPPPAVAAMGEAEYLAAARLLGKYGLVQGDSRGYRFYDQLTRAELAKLLVYSLGQESEAARRAGQGVFPDTRGHWGDGVIAVARSLGIMRGYPEGVFRPQSPLTYAEVITALARLAGLEASLEPWPYTYVGPAVTNGIIPDGMEVSGRLNEAASRGDVFVMLWRTLTEVKNYEGQNLLRRYLDKTPPKLTLDPQPESTGAAELTVSGTVADAAKVLVNGAEASQAYGVFQHTVPLRIGPNTIRVQAFDDAGNIKDATVQVTRVESPPGAVSVTGPAVVAAGESASFTLNIRDQNGQITANRTGVQAKVDPPELGTFDPVTGSFTAGTKPGTGVIKVQVGAAMDAAAVTVVAGSLDQLKITPAEVGLEARGTVVFQAEGADKYGNPVPVGTVTWQAGGGTISAAGVYTAPDAAGSYTVTATAGGKTGTARVLPPNFQVARVELTQPVARLKANGLSELELHATLRDKNGAVVTDYTGTLTVTSSQPGTAAPITASVPVTNGTAVIRVRAGTTPGTARITAATNLGTSAAASVGVDPQQLQSVRLTARAVPSVGSQPTGFVEAVALDTDGNPMRSPLTQTIILRLALTNANARFIANGQAGLDIALVDLEGTTGDVRTRTHISYNAGAGTVVVTGAPVGTNMSWLVVMPGALRADQVGMPAQLRIEPLVEGEAGLSQTVYVNVLDADGYRVTQAAPLSGVVVSLKDQNGREAFQLVSPQAGQGRAEFRVSQTQAGTYTYTATLQPGFASTSVTHQVRAGAVTRVILTATRPSLIADGSNTTVLRAELVDPPGNVVRQPAYRVTFRKTVNNGATQAFAQRTVTTVNGVAEVTVTAGTVVAFDEYEVTVSPTDAPVSLFWASVRITTYGPPERLAISYGDNNGDGFAAGVTDHMTRAGQSLTVLVDVVDRLGNVATFDQDREIRLYSRGAGTTADVLVGMERTVNGRATFRVPQSVAGVYALKAESGILLRSLTAGYGGNTPDALWQAGLAQNLRVQADIPVLQVNTASSTVHYALVSATLLDANGNPAINQTGTPVAVTLAIPEDANGFTYGFFTVDDRPGGSRTRLRSVTIQPGEATSQPVRFYAGTGGTRQISASTLDGATASVTITSTTLGSVAAASIPAIAPVALEPWAGVSGATSGQTVSVTAVDSAGRRLVNFTGRIDLVLTDPGAVVVALWNPTTRTWDTTDTEGGIYAAGTVQGLVDRGMAQFRVRSQSAGVQLYEGVVHVSTTSQLKTTAYGRFDGAGPETLLVAADRNQVAANGAPVTVSARVLDAFGRLLTGVSGTVTFDPPVGGTLSATQAPLVNGVASVLFHPGSAGANAAITATTTVKRPNGSDLVLSPGAIVVDDAPPSLVSLTIANGAGFPGVMDQGDVITLEFDAAIDGASLLAGLSPGDQVTADLGTMRITTTGDLLFVGPTGLTAVRLPGAAVSHEMTFQVASLTLDPTGRFVTLRVGHRLNSFAVAPTVTPQPLQTASVSFSPDRPLRDLAGNAGTAFPAATVIAGF